MTDGLTGIKYLKQPYSLADFVRYSHLLMNSDGFLQTTVTLRQKESTALDLAILDTAERCIIINIRKRMNWTCSKGMLLVFY